MDCLVAISTAHSTYSEGAPLVTKVRLTLGRLVGGWAYFPRGPAGVLHFTADIGGHQILPSTPGQNYGLDDCVVPFHLDYDLVDFPVVLNIRSWNTSTTYDHALVVCVFVNPLVLPHTQKSWLDKLRGK